MDNSDANKVEDEPDLELAKLMEQQLQHANAMAVEEGPMKYHASETVEGQLGLEFVEPEQQQLQHVNAIIRTIASRLGADAEDVKPPPKGFLAEELSVVGKVSQLGMLNFFLGPVYAAENQRQQLLLKKIPIDECKEKMVLLPDAMRGRAITFSTSKYHDACGTWAKKDRIPYVRDGVAERFRLVAMALNSVGLAPHVEDCFRPPEVQEGLLVRRVIDIARKTDWDPPIVRAAAMSLTASSPGLAGHQAGAAIDWTLRTTAGEPLPLGNKYAEGGVNSSINFPYVTFLQWKTRTIFKHTMWMAQFKLLDTEDWHGSRGHPGLSDDLSVKQTDAMYGPMLDFNRATGEIRPYDSQDIEYYYLNEKDSEMLIEAARKKYKHNHQYVYDLNQLIELLNDFRAKGLRGLIDPRKPL